MVATVPVHGDGHIVAAVDGEPGHAEQAIGALDRAAAWPGGGADLEPLRAAARHASGSIDVHSGLPDWYTVRCATHAPDAPSLTRAVDDLRARLCVMGPHDPRRPRLEQALASAAYRLRTVRSPLHGGESGGPRPGRWPRPR